MKEKTNKKKLLKIFVRLFDCDVARISSPDGKMFLILGWNRNTKDDLGEFRKDGKIWNFDYVHEMVVASGETYTELIKSARLYKRLLNYERRRKDDPTTPFDWEIYKLAIG